MASSYKTAQPQPGLVHEFRPNLTAFEFRPEKYPQKSDKVVVFIAGLTNGLLNVPYLPQLAEAVAEQGWNLVQVLLSSAYRGFGVSSLARDVKELGYLVEYLKSETGGQRKKIVLMGHSTGCQDTMEYLSKFKFNDKYQPDVHDVDGGILQAPVSDVEAFQLTHKNLEELTKRVHDEYISQGKGEHILPQEFRAATFNTAITANRFYSLAHPRGSDDYFSSYLRNEDYAQTFGKLSVPILVLYGSKDEFVPPLVNKQKLIDTWKENVADEKYWSPYSKVLPGALHNVGPGSDEGSVLELIDTVKRFLSTF